MIPAASLAHVHPVVAAARRGLTLAATGDSGSALIGGYIVTYCPARVTVETRCLREAQRAEAVDALRLDGIAGSSLLLERTLVVTIPLDAPPAPQSDPGDEQPQGAGEREPVPAWEMILVALALWMTLPTIAAFLYRLVNGHG